MAKIIRNFTFVHALRRAMIDTTVRTTVLSVKRTYAPLIPTRSFKSHVLLLSKEKYTRDPTRIVKKDGTVIRKKTSPVVMINLIKDSEMTVLPLKAAENIAKANGLNLVKIEEKVASTRETYKLVKDSELAKSSKKDDLKTVIISSAIFDNDLQVKMKTIMKILKKHKILKCMIKQVGNNNSGQVMLEKIKEELRKADFPFNVSSLRSTNAVIHFTLESNFDAEGNAENDSKKTEVGREGEQQKTKVES